MAMVGGVDDPTELGIRDKCYLIYKNKYQTLTKRIVKNKNKKRIVR